MTGVLCKFIGINLSPRVWRKEQIRRKCNSSAMAFKLKSSHFSLPNSSYPWCTANLYDPILNSNVGNTKYSGASEK
jgi:hypothetical protein